jgi:cytochrome c oxidase cbb3-type subunit 2
MDAVWGRPSAPGDYAYVRAGGLWYPYAPAVLGSERTGPDLSNVGARQASDVWQYLHLYNPRAVVAGSVMPAFPWLCENKAAADEGELVVPVPKPYAPEKMVVVPNSRGRALVAYLLALRQVPIEGYGGGR